LTVDQCRQIGQNTNFDVKNRWNDTVSWPNGPKGCYATAESDANVMFSWNTNGTNSCSTHFRCVEVKY